MWVRSTDLKMGGHSGSSRWSQEKAIWKDSKRKKDSAYHAGCEDTNMRSTSQEMWLASRSWGFLGLEKYCNSLPPKDYNFSFPDSYNHDIKYVIKVEKGIELKKQIYALFFPALNVVFWVNYINKIRIVNGIFFTNELYILKFMPNIQSIYFQWTFIKCINLLLPNSNLFTL